MSAKMKKKKISDFFKQEQKKLVRYVQRQIDRAIVDRMEKEKG
jgi:hypothetical protein